MAFGKAAISEPWTFSLDTCPLCGKPNTRKFKHKPPTAGARALTVEGGGVSGMIPLLCLQELEMAIDLPMGIQEHFDIIVGERSGTVHNLTAREVLPAKFI
jgi:hypothetical protein